MSPMVYPPPSDVKWSPLIQKDEIVEAREYGYSFGSKMVGQTTSMVNLRFMCHCLGRAVKMHLDFNPTNAHFLQDITTVEDNGTNGFTYNFSKDLKLTLNPAKSNQEDLPSQKTHDIDKQLIEIQSKLQDGNNTLDKTLISHQNRQKLAQEPEPEIEDQFGRDDLDDSDEELTNEELLRIEMLRSDEFAKSLFLKDQKRINDYLSKSKLNKVAAGAILASSGDSDDEMKQRRKAEFLMAGMDLDIIESHGS